MKQYDLLQIMIEATSGYVKNELTSTECSNVMARALNKYTEQLNILCVSKQRELLIAFLHWLNVNDFDTDTVDSIGVAQVDAFLKSN